jgi:hypothetical protein
MKYNLIETITMKIGLSGDGFKLIAGQQVLDGVLDTRYPKHAKMRRNRGKNFDGW